MHEPRQLTLIYDDSCEFCQRCANWLKVQTLRVPMTFLPASTARAHKLYSNEAWFKQKLAVIDEHGCAWIDSPAFVMCLWATKRYRRIAGHLGDGSLEVIARRFFSTLSSNRQRLNRMLGGAAPTAACTSGACDVRPTARDWLKSPTR